MIKEYYDALERLINNQPINVAKNSKINNDTVALEARRKRGSIKKSREVFFDLIDRIKEASNNQNAEKNSYLKKLNKYKVENKKYKDLYLDVLNRELMLFETIKLLEKENNELKKTKLSAVNNF